MPYDENNDYLKRLSLDGRLAQIEDGTFPEYLSKVDLLAWQIECWAHPTCWVARSENPDVQRLQSNNMEEKKKAMLVLDKIKGDGNGIT